MDKPQINLAQSQDTGFGTFLVIENDLIGNFILRHGFWENHLYNMYCEFITPESVIIDAGANIGFHTVQFAKLGKQVYAFEPQSNIFNLLSTNILLNGLSDKVKQYRLGLSDKKIKLHMEPESKSREPNGMTNFGGLGITTNTLDTEVIDLIKWDDEFNNVKIDLIKMDIQGSELYALKGMENMLIKDKPWMLLENYNDFEKDKLVVEYLLSLGYTIYRPMTHLPNEDCICVYNHSNIKKFLETIPVEFKIYKNG